MDSYRIDPEQSTAALAVALKSVSVDEKLLTWCAVHGTLQLALRHAGFPPYTRQIVQTFVEKLGQIMVAEGFLTAEILQEAIRREREFTPPESMFPSAKD
jgi:hypothetical protein